MVTEAKTSVVQQAYDIALETLRNRYSTHGIFAGARHFSDIWVRDSMYASLGALSIGDTEIVKTNLTTCLSHCSPSGQVPLRIGQKHFLLKFLFGLTPKVPQSRFTEDKGISIPTDSNPLLVMILDLYLNQTSDYQFAMGHFESIRKVVDWNLYQDIDNDWLVEEGHYAGWADSLKKNGKVAYTNVLHWKAYESFADLCKVLKEPELSDFYQKIADKIKSRINEVFWNGRYFVDWVNDDGKMQVFSADANLFAIIFGLATHDQGIKIEDYVLEHGLDSGFTIKTCHPGYPSQHIYPPFRFIQMDDYHNGMDWLWIGCVDALAKLKIGRRNEAIGLITRMSEKIIEYNGVYEVYYDGKPVDRVFYSSENWFTWSSGSFVWACNELGILKH